MLVHKSVESRVRKSREGLVCEWCGEKDDSRGSVYEPRRSESKRDREVFEVLQADVVKYEEKGSDVIVMGISMQELDWEQSKSK